MLIVALHVMIGRVFPEEHRPAAFAAMSSAWVVPALVGPVIAGFLTERWSVPCWPRCCSSARAVRKRPDLRLPPDRGVAAGAAALPWTAR
ncbi:hypothetical protein [Saccharopolyspora pogona]|uniref:hypothetical protein n=1 Tax=Saccharopolyspora pogona TaxID=333966 RepID=UPI0021E00708|nr:hypothetical protein [Saccharopolyspora pogona]